MKIYFNNLVSEDLPSDKNHQRITNTYYLLAHLRGEDDEECSKAHWLKTELTDAEAVLDGIAARLPNQNRQDVLKWAGKLFAEKPDYYAIIIEERFKDKFPIHLFCLVYKSPNLTNDICAPRETELNSYLKLLDKQIVKFDDDERTRNLLKKRAKKNAL